MVLLLISLRRLCQAWKGLPLRTSTIVGFKVSQHYPFNTMDAQSREDDLGLQSNIQNPISRNLHILAE